MLYFCIFDGLTVKVLIEPFFKEDLVIKYLSFNLEKYKFKNI